MPADPVWSTVLLVRCLHVRNDRYEGAVFRFRLVLNAAINEGEEGMVGADTDIFASVPFSAALTHDDVAGATGLAAKKLHAEPLTCRVAPVARRAACFLVRHNEESVCVLCLTHFADEIIIEFVTSCFCPCL